MLYSPFHAFETDGLSKTSEMHGNKNNILYPLTDLQTVHVKQWKNANIGQDRFQLLQVGLQCNYALKLVGGFLIMIYSVTYAYTVTHYRPQLNVEIFFVMNQELWHSGLEMAHKYSITTVHTHVENLICLKSRHEMGKIQHYTKKRE